jgi:NADP-dependent 3-hydroxy acid dehydrogenase YdfG
MTTPSSKIILITGTSTGFGRDTAELLARQGHRVFATMRDIAGKNRVSAEALQGKKIEVVELDVTCSDSVGKAVSQILSRTGRIDVVINNAGVALSGVSETLTDEQVSDLFEVNVVGIQRVLRATLPTLRKQGDGLVINVGSILGRVTVPFFSVYGASKHAVEALSDGYRYELFQLGIDVVLVQPGPYATQLYNNIEAPADAERNDAYGEIAKLPGKVFEVVEGIFQDENAPNVQDIPITIAKLINDAKGTRPARVVLGLAFGADAANQAMEPIQKQVVEGLGLGALLKHR